MEGTRRNASKHLRSKKGEPMSTFEQYLSEHQIEPMQLALEADVRYLIVWNALKEKPISQEHALKIRVALYRMTGQVYRGPLPTHEQSPLDQLSTSRGKKSI